MKPDTKILVLGAGLSGLSAAIHLRDQGAEVVVVDSNEPGGKAKTVEPRPGWVVESGPHSFTHRAEAIFRLAARVGVAEQIVPVGTVAKSRYLVRNGVLLQASMLGGALTAIEKLAAIQGAFVTVSPEGSVFDVLSRAFGQKFAEGPGGAATVGVWAARPEEVEMESGFPALSSSLRQHGSFWKAMRGLPEAKRPAGTYGFVGGMATLVQAAVEAAGGVQQGLPPLVATSNGWEAAEFGHFDAVIVATDATQAAEILPAEAAALAREIRYSSLVVAHWLSSDARLPHGFGYLAPPRESRAVLGTLFASDLHPDRTPSGFRSFTSLLGGTIRPNAMLLDNAAVTDQIQEEHRELTGKPCTIDAIHLVRHSRAVALPGAGHTSRIAAIHAALPRTLAVAGAWCGAGAMPDAIASGEQAAAKLELLFAESREVA